MKKLLVWKKHTFNQKIYVQLDEKKVVLWNIKIFSFDFALLFLKLHLAYILKFSNPLDYKMWNFFTWKHQNGLLFFSHE